MPMYEFQCRDCEGTFDDLVSTEAIETMTCKQCGSGDVVRLYSPFAVHAAATVGGGAAVPAGACMPGTAASGAGGGCCGGGCGSCG